MKFVHASVVMVAVLGGVDAVRGGMAPDYDFQWAVIGDVGNEPFPGPPVLSSSYMRGDVDYEYRISKLEVTSGQWMEFLNTIGPLDPTFTVANLEPSVWGGRRDFAFPDGYRYRFRSDAPVPEMVPLNGISWRAAAMYCNWLHNDKAPTLEAIQSGAYDTSTFTSNPDGTSNEQRTHSPDAKFWIPTLDESIKSLYYDSNRFGDGQGGWWNYPTTSNTVPSPGLPGELGAQTSAGLTQTDDFIPRFIPLGSYPDVRSPWGLLDGSGGGNEWTEEYVPHLTRVMRGTRAGQGLSFYHDHIGNATANGTGLQAASFRVVSRVPAPNSIGLGLIVFIAVSRRRNKL